MNAENTIIEAIARRPMEAIGILIAFVMLVGGIVILLPIYPIHSSVLFTQLQSFLIVKALGLWFLGLFGLHFYSLTHIEWPRSYRFRRFCTFSAFVTFLFLTLLRILTLGIGNLLWMLFIIIALIEAISYIRLRWGYHT